MAPTRRQIVTAVAASGLSLAGCTGSGTGGSDAQSTATTADGETGGADATVRLSDTSFQPREVAVETGATVAWVNEDSFEHDVTAAQFHDVAADWDVSRSLGDGDRTTHTFEESGVYEYYCTVHGESTMCGVVLVGGATLEQPLPCESDEGGGGGSGGGAY